MVTKETIKRLVCGSRLLTPRQYERTLMPVFDKHIHITDDTEHQKVLRIGINNHSYAMERKGFSF